MTTLEKKNKILAAIASRGWFAGGIYLAEANELYAPHQRRRNENRLGRCLN